MAAARSGHWLHRPKFANVWLWLWLLRGVGERIEAVGVVMVVCGKAQRSAILGFDRGCCSNNNGTILKKGAVDAEWLILYKIHEALGNKDLLPKEVSL